MLDTISIHAPAQGATPSTDSSGLSSLYFNSRSRTGSDLDKSRYSGKQVFQFTLPHRERLKALGLTDEQASISIHAPAQGATSPQQHPQHTRLFQFTLPHRERPVAEVIQGSWVVISIHAPAQGATVLPVVSV